jgi:hypothetical protein
MRNLRQVPHWTLGLGSAGAPQRMMLMDLVKIPGGDLIARIAVGMPCQCGNMIRNVSDSCAMPR